MLVESEATHWRQTVLQSPAMVLTVYPGDSTRIVWETSLPPEFQQVSSPDFSLYDLNCKLKLSRVPHRINRRKGMWGIHLRKSSVSFAFKDHHVKIYMKNKCGRLILIRNSLIPNGLNLDAVQILTIFIEEIEETLGAVPEDKATLVFDFSSTIIPKIRQAPAQAKEEVHASQSSPVSSYTESLVEDLQTLLEEDNHHDLQLRCGDKSISAHKSILSARSTVLAAMLRNDMQEGRSGVVDIADIDFPVLQQFVRYIYCGRLPELTVELASGLFKAGDKYDVKALVKRCVQFLVESLTVDNACEFLMLADDHSHEEFKEAVITYILDRKVPKEYGGWSRFCSSRPILGLEVLNRYVFKN